MPGTRAGRAPPAGIRAEVLYELGTARTFRAPAVAVEQLSEARALAGGWPLRGKIAVALGEALALCGRFAEAVTMIRATTAEAPAGQAGDPPDDVSGIVASMQAVLLNIARWDLSTRTVTRPLVEELLERAESGTALDPQLHANLAVELMVAGAERERALRHARAAVRAASRLIPLTSTALPEAVLVLSLADAGREAWAGVQEWQEVARRRGAHRGGGDGGRDRRALSRRVTAISGSHSRSASRRSRPTTPGSPSWRRRPRARARSTRGKRSGPGRCSPSAACSPSSCRRCSRSTWSSTHAGACTPPAATTRRQSPTWYSLGADAGRWGIVNPAAIGWRSAAAVSRSALGDRDAARALAEEEIELARRWGAAREIGVALRAAGLVTGATRGSSYSARR